MEIFKRITNIDFMGKRLLAISISLALIAASLVSLATRGLNFGIDFTGGTLVEVHYDDAVDIQQARDALAAGGFNEAVVQYFGTVHDVMVRLPGRADKNSAQLSNEVMRLLRGPYNEVFVEVPNAQAQQCSSDGSAPRACRVQMKRVEFVGPQVGEELTEQGGLAMLYALIGILIYVAWRFEWRFSVGAIGALVHDVILTLGFFSALQVNFDLTVLAAVLAVIGYSLNDTIVVFDRIRENFRKMRKGDVAHIINVSINETLPRTLLTSATTLLVLIALYLYGGDALIGFSLALIVGIGVGTYSSIYVASPMTMWLGLSREDMLPVKREGTEADRAP